MKDRLKRRSIFPPFRLAGGHGQDEFRPGEEKRSVHVDLETVQVAAVQQFGDVPQYGLSRNLNTLNLDGFLFQVPLQDLGDRQDQPVFNAGLETAPRGHYHAQPVFADVHHWQFDTAVAYLQTVVWYRAEIFPPVIVAYHVRGGKYRIAARFEAQQCGAEGMEHTAEPEREEQFHPHRQAHSDFIGHIYPGIDLGDGSGRLDPCQLGMEIHQLQRDGLVPPLEVAAIGLEAVALDPLLEEIAEDQINGLLHVVRPVAPRHIAQQWMGFLRLGHSLICSL